MTVVKFVRLFLVLAFVLGAGVSFKAQAQMTSAGIPQFMPTGAWNVQNTFLSEARSLDGIKLPCMMANAYDNGYIVRMSGGGGTFLAMAIDFRQNAFKQGRKYNAFVSLNNGYTGNVQATAFSESVLIFNVRSFSGFYQALQSSASMVVDIEGNPLQFSLGNFGEATQRLEACFGGAPVNAPMPMGATMGAIPEPQAPGLKSDRDNISKNPNWNNDVKAMPPRAPQPSRQSSSMIWEANAGDDIRATIMRWSSNAGVNVDWQANTGGMVVSDLRVNGSFEDAVQALMAQNAAAMGLEANLMGTPATYPNSYGAPQQITPISSGPSMMPSPVAPPLGGGEGKWNAPAGSSLQQVLSIWSSQAGVELIWESNQGFVVKSAVVSNGTYEDALQSLLSQFTIDSVRPAVQLNNDPVTGRRILLVQSTRV